MREIKECRPFLIRKPMLILTQRHGLTLQVQLLPSVQTFAILVLSTWCPETKYFPLQQGPFSGIWFPRRIPKPVDQINLKLRKSDMSLVQSC
jgi:hypothetical protein